MAFILPDPDIEFDLSRLERPSSKPTPAPSPNPTPEPITPRPTYSPTPEPTPKELTLEPTAQPITSSPTPAPSKNPIILEPVSFLPLPGVDFPLTPAVPAPIEPVVITTPTPATSAPIEPAIITTSAGSIAPNNATTTPASTTPAPTYAPSPNPNSPVITSYYSCPQPPPKTVTSQNSDGKDVLVKIRPHISTVNIEYEFQLQLLQFDSEDEDDLLEDLLSEIQDRLGNSLSRYMKSNTEDGEDEGSCRGYYVEDFRRRRRRRRRRNLNQRRARAEGEDTRTKIVEITTATELSIDDDLDCVPKNDGCHVVRGEYDATYVGFNEAGVKSAISRAVKEEMDEGGGDDDDDSNEEGLYRLSFLGLESEMTRSSEPNIAALNVLDYAAELVPENNTRFTNYGIGILAALGAAFMMLCYVIFVRDEKTSSKVKDKMVDRKERKKEKQTALGERDDERETPVDQSYCYDLGSVAIVGGEGYNIDDAYDGCDGSEAGVELQSSHSSMSAKSKVSDKTQRMSNKADDVNYDAAHKLDSLLEGDVDFGCDEEESYTLTAASRIGLQTVSSVDAGCSVRSSNSAGSRSVSNSGRSHSSRRTDQYGTNSVQSSKSSGETSESSPLANLVFGTYSNVSSDDDSLQLVAMVDRTPSSPSNIPTIDLSPTGDSTVIRQLPSILEAELPPPMNDTPRMNSYRNRGSPLSEEVPSYEECEV